MEEEVYKVPRLLISPYIGKLHETIDQDQILKRYEDLGLEIASDRNLFDSKTELGYLLEDKLVIFEVIDELKLLKELGPYALATNKLTGEGKIIISLQKILFQMNSDILTIVLQEQLDQVLLISEGSSPTEAHDLAVHPDRKRVEQAIKTQLDREFKQLVEEQRKDKHIKVASEVRRKGKYDHPGKEKLIQLIEKYQANLSNMAKDPGINASQPTLSRWINKDPELKQLAEEQRRNKHIKVIIPKTTTSSYRGGRRKKVELSSNPGKDILEALMFNYDGDLRAMAKNPNINTDVETLQFWLQEEGLLKRPKIGRVLRQRKKYDHLGKKKLRELIIKYQGNVRKIADDSSVIVSHNTVMSWINDDLELRRLATEQRKRRKSNRKRKVRVPSNPGKDILEALMFNYKGNLKEMAKNPNINTDVETLWSWIREEGLESLVS